MAHAECPPKIHGKERRRDGRCQNCNRLYGRDWKRRVRATVILQPHPYVNSNHCRRCHQEARNRAPSKKREHRQNVANRKRVFAPHPYISSDHCRDCCNTNIRNYKRQRREEEIFKKAYNSALMAMDFTKL